MSAVWGRAGVCRFLREETQRRDVNCSSRKDTKHGRNGAAGEQGQLLSREKALRKAEAEAWDRASLFGLPGCPVWIHNRSVHVGEGMDVPDLGTDR